LVIFAGLFVSLILPAVALAQGGSGFSLTPYSLETAANLPRFAFDAEPGQTIQSAVLVRNESTIPVHVQIYPADARTAVNGDIDFGKRSDVLTGVGRWVTLEQTDLNLAAGESQLVLFSIRVPDTAQPGMHRAGIMAENVTPSVDEPATAQPEQVQVKITFLEGLNLRMTVPGPTKTEFAITGVVQTVGNGDTIFDVQMANTGGEDVQMTGGRIQIFDAGGTAIGEQPFQMSGLFMARDTVSHPVRFTGLLPEGHYSVQVSVDYGGDAPAQWTSEFDIAPAAQEAAAAEINRGFAVAPNPDDQSGEAAAAPVAATQVVVAPLTSAPVSGTESIWVDVIEGMALIMVLGIVITLIIFVTRSRSSSPQNDYRTRGE